MKTTAAIAALAFVICQPVLGSRLHVSRIISASSGQENQDPKTPTLSNQPSFGPDNQHVDVPKIDIYCLLYVMGFFLLAGVATLSRSLYRGDLPAKFKGDVEGALRSVPVFTCFYVVLFFGSSGLHAKMTAMTAEVQLCAAFTFVLCRMGGRSVAVSFQNSIAMLLGTLGYSLWATASVRLSRFAFNEELGINESSSHLWMFVVYSWMVLTAFLILSMTKHGFLRFAALCGHALVCSKGANPAAANYTSFGPYIFFFNLAAAASLVSHIFPTPYWALASARKETAQAVHCLGRAIATTLEPGHKLSSSSALVLCTELCSETAQKVASAQAKVDQAWWATFDLPSLGGTARRRLAADLQIVQSVLEHLQVLVQLRAAGSEMPVLPKFAEASETWHDAVKALGSVAKEGVLDDPLYSAACSRFAVVREEAAASSHPGPAAVVLSMVKACEDGLNAKSVQLPPKKSIAQQVAAMTTFDWRQGLGWTAIWALSMALTHFESYRASVLMNVVFLIPFNVSGQSMGRGLIRLTHRVFGVLVGICLGETVHRYTLDVNTTYEADRALYMLEAVLYAVISLAIIAGCLFAGDQPRVQRTVDYAIVNIGMFYPASTVQPSRVHGDPLAASVQLTYTAESTIVAAFSVAVVLVAWGVLQPMVSIDADAALVRYLTAAADAFYKGFVEAKEITALKKQLAEVKRLQAEASDDSTLWRKPWCSTLAQATAKVAGEKLAPALKGLSITNYQLGPEFAPILHNLSGELQRALAGQPIEGLCFVESTGKEGYNALIAEAVNSITQALFVHANGEPVILDPVVVVEADKAIGPRPSFFEIRQWSNAMSRQTSKASQR